MENLFTQSRKTPKRTQVSLADTVKLEIVGLIESPEGYTGELRIHPFWELMYINRGCGSISYRGKRHSFSEGDLLLARPYQMHQVHLAEKESLEMLYVGFSIVTDSAVQRNGDVPLALYGKGENPFVKEMLREIAVGLKAGERQLHMGSLLQVLFFVVESLLRTDETGVSGKRGARILAEKAKRFLDSNICRQVSIAELSNELCVSPHYCIDIFREVFNISPKRYHTLLRMNLAATMLRDSKTRISEIADVMGFGSIHHFSKRFKDCYRVSPSGYRKSGVSVNGVKKLK